MVMVFPIMSFLEMLHENVFTMNMEVMLGRNVKVFFLFLLYKMLSLTDVPKKC